ncbi:hypothetical protein GFY24_37215 [Nocardia sp. SYP-A9097]|uniref:hypothetical protein n=1 Tax=Nocardia sp. SYP-A9097 TaxID=2663237 RepID=UPI00129B060A|nr:hypothetical protein [Nocardia sp. SYP-A9097]MRH92997.1 hypothetical protein [Nocardia sp. SYP-A9097]
MTTISTGFVSTTRSDTDHKASSMFTRLFALLAAAGRAIPFHRESSWGMVGSTGITDRDHDRGALELRAIAGVREHS